MKLRLALCVVSVLLALGAASSGAAAPCINTCDPLECDRSCRRIGNAGGFCSLTLCDCRCYN
jgi:hypothetical protein